MIAGLTFDADRHLYRFDGRHVPNVTTILTGLGLIDTRYFTQASRDRGNAVHAAVHYHLEGDLDESTVSAGIRPYLDAAIKFLDDSRAKVYGSEVRLYHPQAGYAGTADVLGEFWGDDGIVDWKSGQFGATIGLQTSGYDTAVDFHPVFAPLVNGKYRRRIGVQLRDDGTYRLADPKYFKPVDRSRFLASVDIYRTFIFREEAA